MSAAAYWSPVMHAPTSRPPESPELEDRESELELDSDARVAIRPANPNSPSTSRITPITIITVPDFLG
ncbi:hypothetical protein, partial [Streptomyces sp. DSM 41634]|uniref:hypothetical protein n=1 Tax=Streptomyces sp. DSM 41634 TaxID=3448656 RepID=UPI00403FE249